MRLDDAVLDVFARNAAKPPDKGSAGAFGEPQAIPIGDKKSIMAALRGAAKARKG